MQLWKLIGITICLGNSIACNSDDSPTVTTETTEVIDNTFKGTVNWKKTFGGSLNEEIKAVTVAPNGDYVILGNSGSTDAIVGTNTSGTQDYWVMRIDPSGNSIWSKTYGGDNDERGEAIALTKDNGFIVTGYSRSTSGDVSANNGSYDHWMVKLDANGTIQWEKNYGFLGDDRAAQVKQTADGGFLTAGYLDVDSYEGPNNPNKGLKQEKAPKKHGIGEFWIHKLDSTGAVEWERFYGGSNNDRASDFLILDDGYLVIGTSESTDFDITNSKGSYDFWIIKINKKGELQWQKNYGGSEIDTAYAVATTIDGNFIIVGDTRSIDGDITTGKGNADLWAIKIAPDGTLLKQKTYGGSGFDTARGIIAMNNKEFIISGSTKSNDGDISKSFGGNDIWLLKIDENLNLKWSTTFGGSDFDFGMRISQTTSGEIIVIGDTKSIDNDSVGNNGKKDALIISITP